MQMEKDEEEEKTVVLQKYIAIRHLEFAWPILLTRYASSRWGQDSACRAGHKRGTLWTF